MHLFIYIPIDILTSTVNSFDAVWYGQTANAYVTPTGGSGPYTARWMNVNTLAVSPSSDLSVNLIAGSYKVNVTDSHGCLFSPLSFTINQPTGTNPPLFPF